MLRITLVLSIILMGILFAFKGPFYILLFYFWNAYFRPDYWVWNPIFGQLNLSLIIGGVLLIASLSALGRFRVTRQTVLILLFFVQSVVSLVMAEYPDWSLEYWVDFAKILTVALLSTVLVTDRHRYRLALLVIAYSLGFEAAKQGWVTLLLSPGGTNINRHPMLGDNNGVAVGMMMLIPLFVALYRTAKSNWERYLHGFFIVGVLYRGLSTYSRGGFVTAAAIGLVALWYSPRRMRALVAIGAFAGVVWMAMPQAYWDRMGTITATEEEQDKSATNRLFFWQVALRMANAKPLTGVGINAYKQAFASYDETGGDYGNRKAVHSVWFGALSEMGYPGLVLIVLIVAVALHSATRIRRQARGDPAAQDMASYAGAMQMSLVAYCVGNTFVAGLYNEFFWHLLGLGVALELIWADLSAPSLVRRGSLQQPAPPVPR